MPYLLDTNILSNVAKPSPSQPLLAWMSEQIDEDLFIASLTVAEIRRGVLEKPGGKRRDQLEAWFSGPEGPQALFAGRILPFDEKAALIWARLMADGRNKGQAAQRTRYDHRGCCGSQRMRRRHGQREGLSGRRGRQSAARSNLMRLYG